MNIWLYKIKKESKPNIKIALLRNKFLIKHESFKNEGAKLSDKFFYGNIGKDRQVLTQKIFIMQQVKYYLKK